VRLRVLIKTHNTYVFHQINYIHCPLRFNARWSSSTRAIRTALFLSLVWYRLFQSIYVLSRLGLTAGNVLFTCGQTPALDLKLEDGESFSVRPVQFTSVDKVGFEVVQDVSAFGW